MSNFRPLARGMTFDTRSRVDSHDAGYFKPLTRSMTWVGGKTNDSGSDVRYRRFFNTSEEQQIRQRLEHRSTISRYRGESFDRDPSVHKHRNQCVVVTDTFSSGLLLASLLYHQGYSIVRLLSADLKELLDFAPDGATCEFIKSLAVDTDKDYESEIEAITRGLLKDLPFPIVAVIAGAETGVELADEISERLGLPLSNGTALSEARRNKFVMGETVRASGVRAVKQLKASSWGEIEIFLAEWQPSPFKVIVKPLDSAGSDDVTLCCSLGEVQAAFGNIMGKVNGLGLVNSFVLVQEYLEGQEYVIDTVSLEGQHKVVAIWAYDRRPANGAHFVCRGQRLLTADEPYCQELIEYQKKVLDALGIKNGPTHGEVKWCRGEPVLVEVGARCHGGDGFWTTVCDEVYGYNQAQVAIDAYLNAEAFARIPDAPLVRHAYGLLKWVIASRDGVLKRYCPADVDEIKSMSSYRGHQFFKDPGEFIKRTQTCFTWAGAVKLANASSEAMEADYSRLEELESSTLIELESVAPSSPRESNGFVAVVDPFSTGALISSYLSERGYQVIAVYSAKLEQLSNLQGLVPKGLVVTFAAVLGYSENVQTMTESLLELSQDNILAVIAGAETGVELADEISERLGLPLSNGTALSEARRNKFVMGETVRASGVRAVKQLKASSWGEIEIFLAEWQPSPFKVIVKPLDSAGSDDVTLCCSLGEVQAAFGNIMGKVNGLGLVNSFVLVQEYLEGQEYVIDTVSLEGQHKVVAIWAYDRRPANGAHFVCRGQRLLTADEPYCQELIEYQKKVLDALGIKNGPTHGEVKWCRGEPVLVEVGARCHGGDGFWTTVCDEVYGYNQAQVAIDAYLNAEAFARIPDAPLVRHAFGRLLFICVRSSGVLVEVCKDFVEEIESMSSFLFIEIFHREGKRIRPTIDCFTFGGLVKLVNKDLTALLKDYERIQSMEEDPDFFRTSV